jgi:glutaredoxin
MAGEIVIYTTNDCAYCGMVKRYLKMKGRKYVEINIQENPVKQKEMIEISGQMRVPVTVVTRKDGSQDIAIGYNITKLAEALAG